MAMEPRIRINGDFDSLAGYSSPVSGTETLPPTIIAVEDVDLSLLVPDVEYDVEIFREDEPAPVTALPIIEPTPRPPTVTNYRDVMIYHNVFTGDFSFEYGPSFPGAYTWPTLQEAKDHVDRIIAFIEAKEEADRIRREQELEVPLIPPDIVPGDDEEPPLDIEPFEPPVVIVEPEPTPFVPTPVPIEPPPVPIPTEVIWEMVFETSTEEAKTYQGKATYEDVAYLVDPLRLFGDWRIWASDTLPQNIISEMNAGPATLLKLRVSVGKQKVLWGLAEWPAIRVESWQHGSPGIIAVIALIVVAWAFMAWLWQKVEEVDWRPFAAAGAGLGLLVLAFLVMQGGNK